MPSDLRTHKPTLELAAFVSELEYEQLPQAVCDRLFVGLLDYLRVASLGERMSWSGWARQLASESARTSRSYVLFSNARYDPAWAAFLNATYAGSIDADGSHVGAMLHPGAIAFSTALAVAQDVGASGSETMAAIAAGSETMIRIALSMQPSHFRRGFQASATCGVFGSAAAAARLLFRGQDCVRRTAEVFGLAASFSGGLTQFYHSGSTVKRIHAAHATSMGIRAALLAKTGFSGPSDILEGRDGYVRAYSEAADFGLMLKDLGSDFRLMETAFKLHACSGRAHAAVEAAVELCQRHGIRTRDIVEIAIGIPRVIDGRLTTIQPTNVQIAQMSVPFSVALAVVHASDAKPGFGLTIDDYARGIEDATVRELCARIRCEVDPEVESATTAQSLATRVTLCLASGQTYSELVDAPKGSPGRPFSTEEHVLQFRAELGRRISPERCSQLIESAGKMPQLSNVQWLGEYLQCEG